MTEKSVCVCMCCARRTLQKRPGVEMNRKMKKEKKRTWARKIHKPQRRWIYVVIDALYGCNILYNAKLMPLYDFLRVYSILFLFILFYECFFASARYSRAPSLRTGLLTLFVLFVVGCLLKNSWFLLWWHMLYFKRLLEIHLLWQSAKILNLYDA